MKTNSNKNNIQKNVDNSKIAKPSLPSNGRIPELKKHQETRAGKMRRLSKIVKKNKGSLSNEVIAEKQEKLRRESLSVAGTTISINLSIEAALGHEEWSKKHFQPLPPPPSGNNKKVFLFFFLYEEDKR